MKKIIYYSIVFIVSIIVIDIFLSSFLNKDVYKLVINKINVVESGKSNKQKDIELIKRLYGLDIPYWTNKYRGPFLGYKNKKQLNCRILGIGDSIIYGAGIEGDSTYLKKLSEKIKNTEVINKGVPGYDLLQEIIKYKEEGLGDDTDLLIWHIWQDDNHIYKLINGVLYDSSIVTNEIGDPELLGFIPKELNTFLLKNSYMYNEILKIKMKKQIKTNKIGNEEFLLGKLKDVFTEYLSKGTNKKIIIVLSPALKDNTYKGEHLDTNGYPTFYNKINSTFSGVKDVNLLYLDRLLKGVSVKDISIDNICHFNAYGHKLVADRLLEYIKTNKLLDDKCY